MQLLSAIFLFFFAFGQIIAVDSGGEMVGHGYGENSIIECNAFLLGSKFRGGKEKTLLITIRNIGAKWFQLTKGTKVCTVVLKDVENFEIKYKAKFDKEGIGHGSISVMYIELSDEKELKFPVTIQIGEIGGNIANADVISVKITK